MESMIVYGTRKAVNWIVFFKSRFFYTIKTGALIVRQTLSCDDFMMMVMTMRTAKTIKTVDKFSMLPTCRSLCQVSHVAHPGSTSQ